MKKKKMAGLLSIALFSFNICFANNIIDNKDTKATNIVYTNDNKTIVDLSNKQYKKINWEKPYIAIQQFDKNKVNDYRLQQEQKYKEKISDEDIEKIYNNGISGDFIKIRQIKKGNINTDFGDYELIWINNENGDSYTSICKSDICTNDLHLKEIDKISGILYGKFNQITPLLKDKYNIKENDYVGLTRIKIKDFFNNKPTLNIHFNEKNEQIYDIDFTKTLFQNNFDVINNDVFEGTLTDNSKTVLTLIVSKDKKNKRLILNDGTIVYSKLTDNSNIVELFYLDFDNEKNPNDISINSLGKIKISQLNPQY